DGKYYRELPGDYTPAVMSMLYYRNVSHRDITATLMNLIRKRHLKMDAINSEKKGFFGKKRERDYGITRLNNRKDKLLPHEEFLLNWLLEDFGDGNTFTFNAMRNSIRRGAEARRFREKYDRWMQTAKEDSLDFGFWDDSGRMGTVRIAIAIVFVILLAICTAYITGMSPNGVFLFGGTIIGLYIVSLSFTKHTRYGSDQYARWKGFRNFLKDFGNIKEAEVPSLVLWEHYLVYAISLDIARRVLDQLRIIIPSEDMYSNTDMNMLTYLYISDMLHGHNDIFTQFEDMSAVFTEITDSAISVAGSQDSSSGGNGGGFSGGGSFGGGGDGGGGFGGF
ncbi:MAG: DUF2207 domain-containing protein, partial [Bacillota bacterium]|nr:DUF2207 domain-containing protein [Bacillota bacterium]